MPSCIAIRSCPPRWGPVVLLTAAVALAVAGCTESQTRPTAESPPVNDALDNVEIDDSPVSLPKTELVTCVTAPPTGYRFIWTGSNQLVPRRPLEESERSSRVSVRFDVDPPDVKTLELQLYFRGNELQIQATSDGSASQLTIIPSGQHRYLLVGTTRNQLSPRDAPHHLRVEFKCQLAT
jgi:hypothetical protein